MPPKKKLKKASIKRDFLAALPTSLTSTSTPLDLAPDLLLRAYGLAGPRPGNKDEQLHRVCANRWTKEALKEHKQVRAPEVLVLDSDDSDEDPVRSLGSSKGKGKAVAKEVCCLEACGGNPRCLNWLGQDKWENTVAALKVFTNAAGVGYNPSNERDPDVPVGLKNLGATCYVNSLLQVWFQDEVFRSGVYACLPSASGNVETSPLFQLQVLFAFLQNSSQGVYNPEALVSSLKLDKGEQQDVQEFSKLFMSLLDHEFKKQGERAAIEGTTDVSKLVQNLFEGRITYGTECLACHMRSERHSSFLELEVNLEKGCSLEDRISESLRDEPMTGDNQYKCDRCDQKQDARRYTVLDVLPPVLHISLLRFVFSAKDFSRSKSTHAISYPLKLDMGQYLHEVDGLKREEWYDLKGVLMHKGASAHHGHYVAQVHERRNDKWFLFDDETVTPVTDLTAPDRTEEEETSPKKPKFKPKAKNGFTRDSNGDIIPKSKDAYMLVYVRRGDPTAPMLPIPIPPPLASARVEELDEKHGVELEEYTAKVTVVRDTFRDLRNVKRAVYRTWDVSNDDEPGFMVDKVEIRRWIESGLKPPRIPAAPEVVEEVKADDKAPVFEPLPMGDVEMAAAVAASIKDDDTPSPDVPFAQERLPTSANGTSIDPIAMVVDAPVDVDPNIISNAAITCVHGMIDPRKAERCKFIGQLGLMALREAGATVDPDLATPRDLCRECVWSMAADRIYEQDHLDHIEEYSAAAAAPASEDDDWVWISKPWLSDWKKEAPRLHEVGTTVDLDPSADPFGLDVLCQHGKLQPDVKKRTQISGECGLLLQSLFPMWKPVSPDTDLCPKCARTADSDAKVQEGLAAIHKLEKTVLKCYDNQTRLGADGLHLVADEDYWLVPRGFGRAWIAWSRAPAKKPRPGPISNTAFLCDHGRLSLDIDVEVDSASLVDAVPIKAWKLLQSNYEAGPPIKITKHNYENSVTYQTIPAMCEPCVEAKRMDFSTTQISIKTLSKEDMDEEGNRRTSVATKSPSPDLEIMETPKHSKHRLNPMFMPPSRSSTRIARKPMLFERKKMVQVDIAKEDTVKDLKVKISTRLDIATIYQRLFFEGREIENDETVETLNICAGAIVELFEVQVDENVDLGDLDDTVLGPSKRGKRVREEGFGGTGLFGWESQEKEKVVRKDMEFVGVEVDVPSKSTNGSKSKRVKAEPVMQLVSCATCTFEQIPQELCEVCELPLNGVVSEE